MVLWFAALLPADWVGVVKPDEALAVRAVQRERVVDAMRLLGRHQYSRHHEPNSVTALGVHNENLRVEIEKHIEGRVARLRHRI
jgi:hypothetical protein